MLGHGGTTLGATWSCEAVHDEASTEVSDLQDALLEAIRPMIAAAVAEEVKRAKLEWKWVPVKRAAELLDLSEHAVHIRCSKGQLPCRKLDGRLFVDMEAVDRRLRG